MGNRQKKKEKKHVPFHEEVRSKTDGRYLGLVCRNSKGKWAATWNALPADDDEAAFCYPTKYEATLALVLRGGEHRNPDV